MIPLIADVLTYVIPAVVGLLALFLAPAVDRWAERFDAWLERR